jgi:hypothetical protein
LGDALLTIISFVVVLGALMSLIGATLGASSKSTQAWVDEARAAYTSSIGDIKAVSATAQESAGTTVIDVVIGNTGNASYADWEKWDVTAQYTTAAGAVSVQRLSYAPTLSAGKWTVIGIYLDAVTRTEKGVEPDVLNPTEQMAIRLQVSPAAGSGKTGMVVITTQDALSTRIHFDP